jgi:AcrR family transcriptional regulator
MKRETPTTKPNKHELRTRQTRDLLLRAAEAIFVRDGYEGAELGEIAAMAGRTKGAIYAHFKSKEDIFLALIEKKRQDYRSQMEKLLAGSTSIEQNMKAYRQFCIGMVEDPAWALLLLEFKLFAMRHPESKERLLQHYDAVVSSRREKEFVELLGPAGQGKDALSRSAAIRALQPLLEALAVETKFAPGLLDKKTRERVAAKIFDALMQVSSN